MVAEPMIIRADKKYIESIVRHRVEMFRSMGWSSTDLGIVESTTRKYLEEEWDTNDPEVILKQVDSKIVGGCAIAFYSVLPDNRNRSGRCGYILNMFIEPEYRGKGYATELIQHIIEMSRARGVFKLSLHDTEMSRRIYERNGFSKSQNYYQRYEQDDPV